MSTKILTRSLLAGMIALTCVSVGRAATDKPVQAKKLQVENELSTKLARTEESNLANVILDAIRAVDGSDAAIMHASAFANATILKGSTDVEEILKAVQYREDNVVVVVLTGDQLRKAFENSVRLYPQKSPEFLQVSGITVTVDPNADKDKRVTSLQIGGSEVSATKKYKVAMPAPLANGALGYYRIWDKKKDTATETGKSIVDAVKSYIEGKKSLPGKVEDRIVFKK
ncbi:MAG: 5'-nucleotidase [Chthonomonadales bacterium]